MYNKEKRTEQCERYPGEVVSKDIERKNSGVKK